MNAFLECATCMIRQTTEILSKHPLDEDEQNQVMQEVMGMLAQTYITHTTPPSLTSKVHHIIKKHLKINDLYQQEKLQDNQRMMDMLPYLNQIIDTADDRLHTAAQLAIAGNIIDYGALATFDIKDAIQSVLTRPFTVDHYPGFIQRLHTPAHIFYVGDNAGELVCDQLFIRELIANGHRVTYAVKSAPILNDVLMADARQTGMDQVTPVIESGSTTAGTLTSEFTPQARELYQNADLIIAKGQGNFETLYGLQDRPGKFFLLKAKCPHLAKHLQLKLRDIIFMEETI